MLDLRYLLDRLDEPEEGDEISLEPKQPTFLNARFRRMNEALLDVIEDFSLVSFHPLQIQDGQSLQHLIQVIDKANGFVFNNIDWKTAVVKDYAFGDQTASMQEQYIDSQEDSTVLQRELAQVVQAQTQMERE